MHVYIFSKLYTFYSDLEILYRLIISISDHIGLPTCKTELKHNETYRKEIQVANEGEHYTVLHYDSNQQSSLKCSGQSKEIEKLKQTKTITFFFSKTPWLLTG